MVVDFTVPSFVSFFKPVEGFPQLVDFVLNSFHCIALRLIYINLFLNIFVQKGCFNIKMVHYPIELILKCK